MSENTGMALRDLTWFTDAKSARQYLVALFLTPQAVFIGLVAIGLHLPLIWLVESVFAVAGILIMSVLAHTVLSKVDDKGLFLYYKAVGWLLVGGAWSQARSFQV